MSEEFVRAGYCSRCGEYLEFDRERGNRLVHRYTTDAVWEFCPDTMQRHVLIPLIPPNPTPHYESCGATVYVQGEHVGMCVLDRGHDLAAEPCRVGAA